MIGRLSVVLVAGASILLTAAAAASEPPVSVDRFLADYDAMEAKARSVVAPSAVKEQWPEVVALKNRMMADAIAYRGDVDAALAAGKPPRACLPPKGQASLDLDDLAAAYRAIPATERGGDERAAFYRYMDKLYPCGR